jgi:hypothetical protein
MEIKGMRSEFLSCFLRKLQEGTEDSVEWMRKRKRRLKKWFGIFELMNERLS